MKMRGPFSSVESLPIYSKGVGRWAIFILGNFRDIIFDKDRGPMMPGFFVILDVPQEGSVPSSTGPAVMAMDDFTHFSKNRRRETSFV
jgi:hypothetical protein